MSFLSWLLQQTAQGNRWNCKTIYMMWISFPNTKTTNFIWSEVYRFEEKQELKFLEACESTSSHTHKSGRIRFSHPGDR